ncbi:MAG TPA: hypothetical protein VMJ65_24700 [Solirubrobacteraceae bacterium]|nr:hypothetical protein [Solirubrobacteraceae bacterium]
MGVPILIFLIAFGAGGVAAAGLLPDHADGRVAGIALLVIAGLAGMTLALIAVHVYEIARQLDNAGTLGISGSKPDVVANGLMAMLRDIGPIVGLAAAVYLLAPGRENEPPPVETG